MKHLLSLNLESDVPAYRCSRCDKTFRATDVLQDMIDDECEGQLESFAMVFSFMSPEVNDIAPYWVTGEGWTGDTGSNHPDSSTKKGKDLLKRWIDEEDAT